MSEQTPPLDSSATPGAPTQARSRPPAAKPATKLMDDDLTKEVEDALAGMSGDEFEALTGQPEKSDGEGPQIIKGKVVSVQGDDVFIDVGGRSEGIAPVNQFDTPPEVGSTVEVIIERVDPESGAAILSRKGAIVAASWDRLKRGDVVEGRVTGMNKGGLEVSLNGGIRAFMPASQCDVQKLKDISILLGDNVQCMVTEIHRRDDQVLVSRRRLQEKEREEKREGTLAELAVDQTRTGVVGNLTDFGAFVDIGGVDGLIHISNMSHARINHPSELLEPGQEVEVRVLKIDEKTGKISLGLKQTAPDPWRAVEQRYPVGLPCMAKVVRLVDFGAFLEIEPGIDALLPISEMSWVQRLKHPSELVTEGQMVQVTVLKIDLPGRKMSVSLKRIDADPWAGVEKQFPQNAIVEGKVARLENFGAFVQLHPGVDGLVHVSEISESRVRAPGDVLKVGEQVKVRVLNVDPNNHKISLSIKAALEPSGVATPEPSADPVKTKKRKKDLRGGLDAGKGEWFIG
jgi:small subunit ribosomal protein S1